MFKKNKTNLNPSLPSSQTRSGTSSVGPISTPSVSKRQSITNQLLAKYENKYASKVKTAESTDSDISDSEPSAEKATIVETERSNVVEVKEELNKLTSENLDEEAIYESDFETSDSDVPENEDPSAISQLQFKDKNALPPTDIDEISEDSIHENILTFEDLLKMNGDEIGSLATHIINSDHDEISEHLENEIEEISSSAEHSVPPIEPYLPQDINREMKSNGEEALFNDNIITFSELLSRKDNPLIATGNQITKENVLIDVELTKELKAESTKQIVEDSLSELEVPVKEVCPAKQLTSDKVLEQLPHQKKNSQSETNISFTGPTKDAQRVSELSSKPKSKRKSNRQSSEERRRLERMFFLVEKQSLTGVVEQPVFKPLAMSWEREAETSGGPLDSQLATPEDAFAEMLRLRLRLTRDKMAAEYAAYRSCCAATQILASSHQPVTLAATRQIISQLKQPDHPEKNS